MLRRRFLIPLCLCLCLCLCLARPAAAAAAAAPDPSFLAGYAAAVLEEYSAGASTVTVTGTTAAVTARGLSVPEKEAVSRALLRVPGLTAVFFPPDPRAYPLNDYGRRRWEPAEVRASSGVVTAVTPRSGRTAFPKRPLFEPLLADPREPQFAGRLLFYRKGVALNRVWAADFGGTVPMIGGDLKNGGQWQFGVQGTVFTLWNLDTVSDDQVLADFLVGLPFTWRWERLSIMAQLYHISAHLGDEFLLENPNVARVNLAYEAVDTKISYAVTDALRVYGGAGRMIRRDPTDTKPGSLQAGVEYLHPRAYWRGLLRPVAALDLEKHEMSGWPSTDVSLRLGAQIENRTRASRRVLLLWEYYKGKDFNGQFFTRSIEYTGFGLHIYF